MLLMREPAMSASAAARLPASPTVKLAYRVRGTRAPMY